MNRIPGAILVLFLVCLGALGESSSCGAGSTSTHVGGDAPDMVTWTGSEIVSINLPKKEYVGQFKDSFRPQVRNVLIASMVSGLPQFEPSFEIRKWITHPIGEAIKNDAENLANRVATELADKEAGRRCRVAMEYQVEGEGAAILQGEGKERVDLRGPRLGIPSNPVSPIPASLELGTVGLQALVEALVEVLAEDAGGPDLRDPIAAELDGVEPPSPGKVLKVARVSDLAVSAKGDSTRSLGVAGGPKFDGARSDGTSTKNGLPKDGSVDVYDRWIIEWTYDVAFSIKTAVGTFEMPVSKFKVQIHGAKQDAFKVTIQEE